MTDFVAKRREHDGYIVGTQAERAETVAKEIDNETKSMAESRDEYVSSLEGTGMVGPAN